MLFLAYKENPYHEESWESITTSMNLSPVMTFLEDIAQIFYIAKFNIGSLRENATRGLVSVTT
jgi:hypothetical protein